MTDTLVEDQEHIDWHYHENAYFTLILQGKLIEGNKKENYNCSAGHLLFHGPREPHYDIKLEGKTKFFNVEFSENVFDDFALDTNALQGSFPVENPDIKFLLYKTFQETKIRDRFTPTSIQMILLEILGRMLRLKQAEQQRKPLWAKRLKEIIHDGYAEKLTLAYLANELNIHPVHLSRDFPKHFLCAFGEYVRKARVEKALALLPDRNRSLTDIAFECGFADQSHFLRCFKQVIGINPYAYRKLLLG